MAGTGPMATKHQFPCQTPAACPVHTPTPDHSPLRCAIPRRSEAVFQCCTAFITEQLANAGGPSPDCYSLVLFSDHAKVLLQAHPLTTALRAEVEALGAANRPRDGTQYGPALREVQRLTRAVRADAHWVVFLSDGRPGDHVGKAVMQRLYDGLRDRLRLHAVGIGPEDFGFLRELAAVVPGSVFHESTLSMRRQAPGPGPPAEPRKSHLAPPAPNRGSSSANKQTARAAPDPPLSAGARQTTATTTATTLTDTFSSISASLTLSQRGRPAPSERVVGLEAPEAWRQEAAGAPAVVRLYEAAVMDLKGAKFVEVLKGHRVRVALRQRPFGRGGTRNVYHMWVSDLPPGGLLGEVPEHGSWTVGSHMVAKESRCVQWPEGAVGWGRWGVIGRERATDGCVREGGREGGGVGVGVGGVIGRERATDGCVREGGRGVGWGWWG